jgi:hypothetical protein
MRALETAPHTRRHWPTLAVAVAVNCGLLYMLLYTSAYTLHQQYTKLEGLLMTIYMFHVFLAAFVLDILRVKAIPNPTLAAWIFFILGFPISVLYARILCMPFELIASLLRRKNAPLNENKKSRTGRCS